MDGEAALRQILGGVIAPFRHREPVDVVEVYQFPALCDVDQTLVHRIDRSTLMSEERFIEIVSRPGFSRFRAWRLL